MAAEPFDADLAHRANGLLADVVRQILAGDAMDRPLWRHLAAECERAALSGAAESLPASVSAIQQLAPVVLADDLAQARRLADAIPDLPRYDLASRLAAAIVADREIESAATGRAAVHAELAQRLYELLADADGADERIAGLKRIVGLHRNAGDAAQEAGDTSAWLQATGMFVAYANILAIHHDVEDFTSEALGRAAQVMTAPELMQPEHSGSLVVLANNLMTTHRRVAQDRLPLLPAAVKKMAAVVDVAQRAFDVLDKESPDAEMAALSLENCVRELIKAQVTLARSDEKYFASLAGEAWTSLGRYAGLASQVHDPDMVLRACELKRQACNGLLQEVPDWVPPGAHADDVQPPETDFDATYRARQLLAKETVEHVRAAGSPERQFERARSALTAWYGELQTELRPVLAEIGLNHHAVKLLAALGAIASGRLGSIASEVTVGWMFERGDESSLRGYARDVYHRQELLAIECHAEDVTSVIIIAGIAQLVEAIQPDAVLFEHVQGALRELNAQLLRQLLAQDGLSHFHAEQSRRADHDLLALKSKFTAPNAQIMLRAYRDAAATNGPDQ